MSPAIAASAAASRTASRIAAVRPAAFQSASKFSTRRPSSKYPAACQISASRFIFLIHVVATVTCGPPNVKVPLAMKAMKAQVMKAMKAPAMKAQAMKVMDAPAMKAQAMMSSIYSKAPKAAFKDYKMHIPLCVKGVEKVWLVMWASVVYSKKLPFDSAELRNLSGGKLQVLKKYGAWIDWHEVKVPL